MAIGQYEAKLVAIFVQGILYGAFIVMFILTYWTLVHRRPPGRRLNKPMLGVSIALFVLATVQVIINFVKLHQAYVTHTSLPGPYWDRLSDFTQVFGGSVYVAQTIVGDGVALYRCYIVWSRRLEYIAFPALLFFGSIATGIGTLVGFGKQAHAEIFHFRHWIVAFFSCTLATSSACTLMIATRIWLITRRSISDRSGSSLQPIMRIVLESGAIYSCTLITLLILFETKCWFQYVVFDALSPIIGLTFSIIIVRIGLGLTTDGSCNSCCETHTHTHHPTHNHESPVFSSRFSSSRFWPIRPERPLSTISARGEGGGGGGVGGGNNNSNSSRRRSQLLSQSHYHLRSRTPHPSSFFRTSEEMEIDEELEIELDEARYERPKALPIALVNPRSGH